MEGIFHYLHNGAEPSLFVMGRFTLSEMKMEMMQASEDVIERQSK